MSEAETGDKSIEEDQVDFVLTEYDEETGEWEPVEESLDLDDEIDRVLDSD